VTDPKQPAPGTDLAKRDPDEVDEPASSAVSIPTVPAPTRRQRRSAEERRKLAKDHTVRAVADVVRKPLELTYDTDGAELEEGSGEPSLVRKLVADAVRLAESAGEGLFRVKQVSFPHSVTIQFVPVVAGAIRETIDRAVEDDPEREVTDDEIQLWVPESVAAAAEISHVLSLPPEQAFPEAMGIRASLARAYAETARTLVETGASVTIEGPGETVASIDRTEAQRVVDVADQGIDVEPTTITIRGVLIGADSSSATFKVRLDPEAGRPDALAPQLKNVEGNYNTRSREAVEKQSLWNSGVVADVLLIRKQFPDRTKPTITGYSFQDIRPYGG
jgi:hypothetical protein